MIFPYLKWQSWMAFLIVFLYMDPVGILHNKVLNSELDLPNAFIWFFWFIFWTTPSVFNMVHQLFVGKPVSKPKESSTATQQDFFERFLHMFLVTFGWVINCTQAANTAYHANFTWIGRIFFVFGTMFAFWARVYLAERKQKNRNFNFYPFSLQYRMAWNSGYT